ncbi:hypothetical protein D3C73_1553410 [compost metagenome]
MNIVATRDDHDPAVVLIIAHDLRIAEVPAAIFAAGIRNDSFVAIVLPCSAVVLAVGHAHLLIAAGFIGIVRRIVGYKTLTAYIPK